MAARCELATAILAWSLVCAGCGGSGLKAGRAEGDAASAAPDTGAGDLAADGSSQPDTGVDVVADALPGTADALRDAINIVDATDAVDVADATMDQLPPHEAGVDVGPPCPVDCAHLPNVKPGSALCSNNHCVLVGQPCEPGFAHCSADPNDGCETDLSSPLTCGTCTNQCFAPYSACLPGNGTFVCSRVCTAPLPDSCDMECVDFQNDLNSCGGCGVSCFIPNARPTCVQGQCQIDQCKTEWADCTSEPGCETSLGTAANCAGCNDPACAIANAIYSCSSSTACATALCQPGFGNCNTTSPDCETAFDPGGACLPSYRGTTLLPTTSTFMNLTVTIAPDGSSFMTGNFGGTVDFDPTDGQDLHTATGDNDGYITKLNPDGSYAWTRTLATRGLAAINQLAIASDGALVVAGNYGDSVDLDPGAGTDLHQTISLGTSDAYVLKLAADGTFIWSRTFPSLDPTSNGNLSGVVLDANDSIYAVGYYNGSVDLDPGPAMAVHASAQGTGMLLKLTSGGTLSWATALDNFDCLAMLKKVALATDGALWTVGTIAAGPSCLQSNAPTSSNDAFIAAFEPSGSVRGTWRLGGPDDDDNASGVAAAPNGAVYVSGLAWNIVDLDPGPGVATHLVGAPNGGYLLKLASDGSLLWAHTIVAGNLISLAATPDGGVLGLSPWTGPFVTKVNSDGSGVWSFVFGNEWTTAYDIATNGTAFAVIGTHNLIVADFDPGPNMDIISGADLTFLSRFAF